MKVLENNARVAEIEARLTKYSYLSRKSLPGAADGRVFQALEQTKSINSVMQSIQIVNYPLIFIIGTSSCDSSLPTL